VRSCDLVGVYEHLRGMYHLYLNPYFRDLKGTIPFWNTGGQEIDPATCYPSHSGEAVLKYGIRFVPPSFIVKEDILQDILIVRYYEVFNRI
jgi:hypothetical protein